MLAACSQNNEPRPPHGHPPFNPELDSAMKACFESSNQDKTAFEACMKAKGFEKPAHPSKAPQGK